MCMFLDLESALKLLNYKVDTNCIKNNNIFDYFDKIFFIRTKRAISDTSESSFLVVRGKRLSPSLGSIYSYLTYKLSYMCRKWSKIFLCSAAKIV